MSEPHYKNLTEHDLHLNSYTSNSRGIVILKKESSPASNFLTETIFPSNLTKILFYFEDQKYIILALYSRWKDDINFFEKVFDDDLTDNTDMVSYAGDWNISLSQFMDASGYLHEISIKNQEFLKEKMTLIELTDIWRMRNESRFDYTWANNQWKIEPLLTLTFPSFTLSDHHPLTFTKASNSMANGPSFWRLDNYLLKDPLYLNECKQVIRTTVIAYLDLYINLQHKISFKNLSRFNLLSY